MSDFAQVLLFGGWTMLCIFAGIRAGYRDGFRNGEEAGMRRAELERRRRQS